MQNAAQAKRAAEKLGAELARRGARLLVYGGPFLEADVVRGFVAGKPAKDRGILMWYSKDQEPPAFQEEAAHPNLFERRVERGADWEIAFYRSVGRADGVILAGGGNATKICGQVAIGTRMPLLCLAAFGGAASRVWDTLSAGEDLPIRAEIDLMGRSWTENAAHDGIEALYSQIERRRLADGAPPTRMSVLAGALFLVALAVVPGVLGWGDFAVWMLFLAPLMAGAAGAAIRPFVDGFRGGKTTPTAVLSILVLGLIAGGIAGLFFVTAQLTADPTLTDGAKLALYARHSVAFAVAVGFIAGLTSDAVFGKLLGLDVVRTTGIGANPRRSQDGD